MSQARPAAAGRPGRLRPAASGEPRPPLGLTPRGAVLLLVAFALAATAVYPLRQYVSQQDRPPRGEPERRARLPGGRPQPARSAGGHRPGLAHDPPVG